MMKSIEEILKRNKIRDYLILPPYFDSHLYISPFWKTGIFIIILNTIVMLLGLVNPYLTKLVIDRVYINKDVKLFITLLIIGGIFFILNNVIGALANYFKISMQTNIKYNLTMKVFNKLQTLPYSYFQNSSSGQNLYRFNYDIESVSSLVSDVFPQIIQLVFRTVAVLGVIFYLNWKMAVCSLILMPPFYFITFYLNRKLKKKRKEYIEINQKVFTNLQEMLTHIPLIKAFRKERHKKRQYVKILIKNIRINLNLQKWQAVVSNINLISSRLFLGIILLYGVYQVIKGELPLGSLIAIGMYLNQLSGFQGNVSNLSQQVSFSFISCERLGCILNSESDETEKKDAIVLNNFKGKIDFKDVSFYYTEEKMILKDLSFSIREGTCIGLVGPSGYGKTTIVNLLLRFYRPSDGEIILDRININNIEKKIFYNHIGVALQNSYLWDDTIENNIKFGKSNATDEEVVEAAKVACIDEFIDKLPDGYKTFIGENACKISEGQRQRISIARAVIKKPAILILDEGLSSVDAGTEDKIINNIKKFLKESTVIIISHRLSTMKKVDLIYFLMNPEKIYVGTYDDMVNNNIHYQSYLNLYGPER
ncbi:MAG: ABC transporter ATP-binding protein [Candidatus Eremiobacterota bacterium]